MEDREIKEISLATEYYGLDLNPNCFYKDLLRVSAGWISYVRTDSTKEKEIASWSYKTNSEEYKTKYRDLLRSIEYIEQPMKFATDSGEYNIRITYMDGSHDDFDGTQSLSENGLGRIAEAFRAIIPNNETHPDFIDECSFYRDNLTKEVLETIEKNDIVALMYAEWGAMGNPGEIEIITKDGVVYSNDASYSGKEIPKEQMVNQFDVTALFDGFHHVDGFEACDFNFVTLNGGRWLYMNLGYGNHLYISYTFYQEYGNLLFDTVQPRRYKKWSKLTKR